MMNTLPSNTTIKPLKEATPWRTPTIESLLIVVISGHNQKFLTLQSLNPGNLKLTGSIAKGRTIKKAFINNRIHTAKYNVITFLPKNLFY